MGGFHILRAETSSDAGGAAVPARLLLRREKLEIMYQHIAAPTTTWICPFEDGVGLEFFMILKGRVRVLSGLTTSVLFAGDCFYADDLEGDVCVVVDEDCDMLCVSDKPAFDTVESYKSELSGLLNDIDAKDHITLTHCKNVLYYCVQMFERLDGASDAPFTYDDFTYAALFHDVGKCRVRDEILKKSGRLTSEEYSEMQRHALMSSVIISERFGQIAADIALQHHERLDGSGYPNGLVGCDINLGARILAVADSYDAMTSARTYNIIKTPAEAVKELRSLPDKYDIRAVEALASVIRESA